MPVRYHPSMKEKIITVGLIAVGFVVAMSLRKGDRADTQGEVRKPPVKYKIVKGGRQKEGISMEVVVAPDTLKEQALELGNFLRDKYLGDNAHVEIGIFDDIRCAVGRFNTSIPQGHFFRHYLVQVSVDTSSGLDTVEWIKK